MYEFTPTVGLGTTVNTKLEVEVHTPLEPCSVAIPAASVFEKGGVAKSEALGATGVELPNKFGV